MLLEGPGLGHGPLGLELGLDLELGFGLQLGLGLEFGHGLELGPGLVLFDLGSALCGSAGLVLLELVKLLVQREGGLEALAERKASIQPSVQA